MIVLDLLDEDSAVPLVEVPWGVPLIHYVNKCVGESMLGLSTRICDVRPLLETKDPQLQFEVLTREIVKGDFYTGEIWTKLQTETSDVQKKSTEVSYPLFTPRAIILFALLFLVVLKMSYEYALTGQLNMEILSKIIDALLSLVGLG